MKREKWNLGFERALESALAIEAAERREVVRNDGAIRSANVGEPREGVGALIARGQVPKPQYRSALEADYAERLELQRAAGEILAWWYEPFTLNFAGKAGTNKAVRYTIDFLVLPANREIEIHETKGRFRRGERERLKLAAASLPFIVKAITREDGAWKEERF